MVFKYLEYAPHAAQRMVERGFTGQDVRWLIETGLKELAWTPVGADQRYRSIGYLERFRSDREAGVVYIENAVRYLIITVEWMD